MTVAIQWRKGMRFAVVAEHVVGYDEPVAVSQHCTLKAAGEGLDRYEARAMRKYRRLAWSRATVVARALEQGRAI